MIRHRIFGMILASMLTPAHAGDWTVADTDREAAFLTLGAIDWAQTLSTVIKQPDRYRETNRFLGRNPSRADVNVWFAFGLAAHVGISAVLPQRYRVPFQYVTIVLEAGQVVHSYRIGVRIDL